jgi:hypothetical protein
MTVAIEMQPTYDQVVKTILPVYQKYFTIPELQELNKFYSTEAMQNMSAKLPLIMQDLRPIQVKQMHELQQKFLAKLTETLKSKDE